MHEPHSRQETILQQKSECNCQRVILIKEEVDDPAGFVISQRLHTRSPGLITDLNNARTVKMYLLLQREDVRTLAIF